MGRFTKDKKLSIPGTLIFPFYRWETEAHRGTMLSLVQSLLATAEQNLEGRFLHTSSSALSWALNPCWGPSVASEDTPVPP